MSTPTAIFAIRYTPTQEKPLPCPCSGDIEKEPKILSVQNNFLTPASRPILFKQTNGSQKHSPGTRVLPCADIIPGTVHCSSWLLEGKNRVRMYECMCACIVHANTFAQKEPYVHPLLLYPSLPLSLSSPLQHRRWVEAISCSCSRHPAHDREASAKVKVHARVDCSCR